MVCDKCQAKLGKAAPPDPYRIKNAATLGVGVGAPSSSSSSSSSSAGAGGKETDMAIGGRKIGENKLLNKSARNTFEPYSIKCKVCKQKIHQAGSHYCQQCAYKLGICAMCGKKILDTTNYRQSST